MSAWSRGEVRKVAISWSVRRRLPGFATAAARPDEELRRDKKRFEGRTQGGFEPIFFPEALKETFPSGPFFARQGSTEGPSAEVFDESFAAILFVFAVAIGQTLDVHRRRNLARPGNEVADDGRRSSLHAKLIKLWSFPVQTPPWYPRASAPANNHSGRRTGFRLGGQGVRNGFGDSHVRRWRRPSRRVPLATDSAFSPNTPRILLSTRLIAVTAQRPPSPLYLIGSSRFEGDENIVFRNDACTTNGCQRGKMTHKQVRLCFMGKSARKRRNGEDISSAQRETKVRRSSKAKSQQGAAKARPWTKDR